MKAVFPFFLFLSFSLVAQDSPSVYERGIILDSMVVPGTKNETFALYLPQSFEPNGPTSIVFIFDPAGRGKTAVTPFIKASEKYGHMLVCSNNSKNGPYERNFEIVNNLFSHVFSNFHVKEDEIYASGFSGGSRLASAIATLTDQFAGVIACGAGFSDVPAHVPSIQKYSYVGLCGDKDMNYSEMLQNKEYLQMMEFNSTLMVYDGAHQWPDAEQLVRAFDWLHLQKLKKAYPRPDGKIKEQYLLDSEVISASNKNPLLLAEQYERMLNDYRGLIKIDSLDRNYQALLRSKEFKALSNSLKSALKSEKTISEKLVKQMTKDFENVEKVNWARWEKEIDKLDRTDINGDNEMKKMVFRVKFNLYVRAHSQKNALLQNASEKEKTIANRFLEILQTAVYN